MPLLEQEKLHRSLESGRNVHPHLDFLTFGLLGNYVGLARTSGSAWAGQGVAAIGSWLCHEGNWKIALGCLSVH